MSRPLHARSSAVAAFLCASLCLLLSAAPGYADGHGPGTYAQVQKFMQDLAHQYPDTTKVFDLGPSDEGSTIQGLIIGRKGEQNTINNLLVATHHGNEYGSTEVAKAFAASVAANPIPGQVLYVIPVLNVWGYNQNERREQLGNDTLDPNRNYPGPCGTEGPFTLKDTTELAKLIDEKQIVTSATLHTFYPAVVYPWGISTQDTVTADDDLFKKLVGVATEDSHYQTGNSTQVIYPADGCYEDYAYWKLGIWSILFELGDTHTPTDTQVEDMIRTNVPGLRNLYVTAPRQRSADHDFKGKCDTGLRSMDRHDE